MKILYVSTISDTTNAFLVPHIEFLIDQGHHVDIACNIQSEIAPDLLGRGCEIFNIGFQRNPLSIDNLLAYKKLKNLIIKNKYDLVHTHTPVASTCVRLACRCLKDVKVYYTAHGFHFFKGAPIKNWLSYYLVEKWLSIYTDLIVTINKEDYNRARQSLWAGKVEYMPGVGLDIGKYRDIAVDKQVKRIEISVPGDAFVVLSVGELNVNKNHGTCIRALAKLKNPQIHYVICGVGPLKNYLLGLARDLDLKDQVHFLGFRKDIGEIYKSSDIFAFPSLREGLGMSALEAMACGLPLVTSNVHGIVDYSVNGITGYTCDPMDVDGFAESIGKLFLDEKLLSRFSNFNKAFVENFSKEQALKSLRRIYGEI